MNVVKRKFEKSEFQHIEKIRQSLLGNSSTVNQRNWGATSKLNFSSKTIRNIASTSLSSPKKGEFLYALVKYLDPRLVVELGTSLGISTLYLSSANKNAEICTFEGNSDLINQAKNSAELLKIYNIKFIEGNFDVTLPVFLKEQFINIDLVFLDGNHRLEATSRYFELILPHLHENSVLIVDDIYWSREMTKAWQMILSHEKVFLSVDFFEFGIIFMSNKCSKQHFTLKY